MFCCRERMTVPGALTHSALLSCFSFDKKVVNMKQQGSQSFGFNIRGGEYMYTYAHVLVQGKQAWYQLSQWVSTLLAYTSTCTCIRTCIVYLHCMMCTFLLLPPGKEFGCGIYVSSVLPSSKAAQCGLKVHTCTYIYVHS